MTVENAFKLHKDYDIIGCGIRGNLLLVSNFFNLMLVVYDKYVVCCPFNKKTNSGVKSSFFSGQSKNKW